MATGLSAWTLKELAELLQGEAFGDPQMRLRRPVAPSSSDPEGISFAESESFLTQAEEAPVGCVLIDRGTRTPSIPHLRVDRPREAFRRLLEMAHRPLPLDEGVHPAAVVSEDAEVSPTARIGPYVVIEAGAVIGPGCRIYPFSYVGEGCSVGEGSILFPHVVLYQEVRMGRFCVVHSGAVLGADGFGYGWDGKRRIKVPQVGGVTLADDVEIGALTAIDRATVGDTQIGSGTKLDNLIQVGHNVTIGDHSVIAGHTSFGGSSHLGSRAMVGGQVALSDHVTVADDVVLAGRSGVTRDVSEAGQYYGLPLQAHREGLRSAILVTKLPEIASRLRDLERRLKELEGR